MAQSTITIHGTKYNVIRREPGGTRQALYQWWVLKPGDNGVYLFTEFKRPRFTKGGRIFSDGKRFTAR